MQQRWLVSTLLAVIMLIGVSACTEQPLTISLQLLAAEQHSVNGRQVVTEGVVHSFADPLHYWIEDDNLNRVGLAPDELVADLVGQRVQVSGRFHADPERGRWIDVAEVQVLTNLD